MTSRDTDNQTMSATQFAQNYRLQASNRIHEIITSGAKGLALLNGGAAVAMLAFVQALVEKPVYQGFKPYAVGGLACFLVGAFLASVAFFYQYNYLNHTVLDDTEMSKLYWRKVWGMLVLSALTAAFGGAIVTIGIWRAV